MKEPILPGMIEATRLTQSGKLIEATTLLQRILGGAPREVGKPAPSALTADALLVGVEAAVDTAPPEDAAVFPGVLRTISNRFKRAKPTRVQRSLGKGQPRPATADVVPPVGTFITKSFSSASAGSRNYKLYVPSTYRGKPRPLVVMLHGCTQSPDDFAAGTRMNFAAEEHACFVAYPEQTAAANFSKCWNWFNTADQKRDQGEPSLIAGITRQIMADYKIDSTNVFIAGMSAGGAAAAVLGETYPDLFSAVGVHSGLACGVAEDLMSAMTAMRGDHRRRETQHDVKSGRHPHAQTLEPRTIVFHGDRDTTVHPRNGADVIARANARSSLAASVETGRVASGHPYTRTIQRDSKGRAVFEHWVVHGAGHAWSGGSTAGSFTDPQGPDATREMLRFFLEASSRSR